MYNSAHRACNDLRKVIAGDLDLSIEEIESRKFLIKEASEKSFYFFAKSVLSFDLLTKETHKKWCDKIQIDIENFNNLMRLKPRATFKTTIYGEALPLWVWIKFSSEIRIFYTSSSDKLLGEVSAHMDHFIGLDSESLYTFVFGIKRDKKARENTRYVFNTTGRDPAAKGNSLMFGTCGGGTNGVHPHFIIIDDPCDSKDRESEAVRTSKHFWYDSLIPLLVPYEKGDIYFQKKMIIATR